MTHFFLFFGLAVCSFELLMVYMLCEAFLDRRCARKYQDFSVIVCFSAVLFLINQQHNPMLNLIASLTISYLLSLLLFSGYNRERIYCCGLACFVIFAAEHIGYRIMGSDISRYGFFPMTIATILIKLTSFIILQIICCNARSKKMLFNGTRTTMICFFLYPVSSFILLLGLRYTQLDFDTSHLSELILIAGLGLLLFSNMLLFFLYDHMICISEQVRAYELSQTKDALTQQHFAIIQETNQKYSSLLHDVNNYVKTMQTLQRETNSDALRQTADALMSELSEISQENLCASPIINAILHEKQQEAQRRKVAFQLFVEPMFPNPSIPDNDLISLFCNLLDNAIEAATPCTSGYVNIHCFVNGTFEVIKIQNSYQHKLLLDQNHLVTSKADKSRHGFGMKRVTAIVERCHGTLTCDTKGNVFTVVVLLPFSLPS